MYPLHHAFATKRGCDQYLGYNDGRKHFASDPPFVPARVFPEQRGKLEIYHRSGWIIGFVYCCARCSLRFVGGLSREDSGAQAISFVRFIFRECAQALKELYIHDDSDWWEEYIFDDFSCFNLEKLVFVASSNIHDRFFEVLDLDNPEIRDLPAPRLRSLSIRGLDAQSGLE